MKSLLLLTLLFLQTPSFSTKNQAQSTDIIISWSYPTLEVVDVPREFNGTLKVNSSKPISARVTISWASLSRDGLITLEGQVTYAKTCTMRFRSSLSMLVNPLISDLTSGSTWTETLERCPSKMVSPSSGTDKSAYTSTLRVAETGDKAVYPLSAFSLAWSTPDGSSRQLELQGQTSVYLRIYRPK